MFRFVLIAFVVIRAADGLGDLGRNQAITFLSASFGWRVYEANSLLVNPNLSIAPTSLPVIGANQKLVLVNFGNGGQPVLGLATVGAFQGSQLNRRHGIYKNRAYDLDTVIVSPVPLANNTNTNQTAATPIGLTFLPVHSQTNQCLVARVAFGGGTNAIEGVVTNINTIGGAGTPCAIFVRNTTDNTLLDAREIRKCELALRKCSRAFGRVSRSQKLFELTTLIPS